MPQRSYTANHVVAAAMGAERLRASGPLGP
jgi:hypothetical protein